MTSESVHQVTILFSNRGTPKDYRHMHGFGSHSFKLWNDNGEYVWAKFHLKTLQEIQNLIRQEATKLCRENPDHATNDLFDAINYGEFPAWEV